MEIISKKDEIVFKNEYNGKVYYSIGLSKKKQDGTYENGYITTQFKKDVELENKTKIRIKKSWIDFYVKDKKTIPYIFVSEFEVVPLKETKPYEEFAIKTESQIGEQIQINPEDYPF